MISSDNCWVVSLTTSLETFAEKILTINKGIIAKHIHIDIMLDFIETNLSFLVALFTFNFSFCLSGLLVNFFFCVN